MARDRPVLSRRPRERRGARRPHTSPTPAPENVSAGPSQMFHTPPPISACDPADEFRPLYCPHCQKLISTNQAYGYLCPWCFVSLSSWRQDMFVRVAYGFCLGPCNGMLSNEERLAQQSMCSNCSGGHESNLRDYISIDSITSGPKHPLYDVMMQDRLQVANYIGKRLVPLGICKNIRCFKKMQLCDSLVPGSKLAVERYVYCPGCRTRLAEDFPTTSARGYETTTAPLSSGVIWQSFMAQIPPRVQIPFPDLATKFGSDNPVVSGPPASNRAYPQE